MSVHFTLYCFAFFFAFAFLFFMGNYQGLQWYQRLYHQVYVVPILRPVGPLEYITLQGME